MTQKIKKLQEIGCETVNTMKRFSDDEEFLIECILLTLEDENFEILVQKVEDENEKAAFEAAHSLKGICGNTGLSPLYDILSIIVEELRKGSFCGVKEQVQELLEVRLLLKKVME